MIGVKFGAVIVAALMLCAAADAQTFYYQQNCPGGVCPIPQAGVGVMYQTAATAAEPAMLDASYAVGEPRRPLRNLLRLLFHPRQAQLAYSVEAQTPGDVGLVFMADSPGPLVMASADKAVVAKKEEAKAAEPGPIIVTAARPVIIRTPLRSILRRFHLRLGARLGLYG